MRFQQHAFRALLASALAASISLAGCKPKTQEGGQTAGATSTEMEAINQLHQKEMEASKKWDVDTLVSLWTDDIVTLFPDRNPIVGKEANRNWYLQLNVESNNSQVTEYAYNFNEVKVIGEWAFEWGILSLAEKPTAASEPVRSNLKLMRILKRDSDGSWKIARAMYNSNEIDAGAPAPQ